MGLKVLRLADPDDYDFARATRHGTWVGTPSRRAKPLRMSWEPGSVTIGDFTWPGLDTEVVLTERAVTALEGEVSGFELGEVVIEKPERRRGEPCVDYPYCGPPLFELWPTGRGVADLSRSTVVRLHDDSRSVPVYRVTGVERVEKTWNASKAELVSTRYGREPGHGLTLVGHSADIFRISEFPGHIFCTERVRDIVKAAELTNAGFLEVGEVDDGG